MHAPSATCSQHALREAVGVCVRCRAAMCSECITKIDGINHCRRCLEALIAEQKVRPARKASFKLPSWLVLGFGALLLSGLMWVTLEVLMPGSAP